MKLFDGPDEIHQEIGEPEVLLYSDGACSGNPGPGGWAFILHHLPSGKNVEAWGSDLNSTNNQMELTAVIEGLRRLRRPVRVQIVTDSIYVVKGATEWMPRWKSRGWKRKTSSGLKAVKNLELWKELERLLEPHSVTFKHIKGHSGHPENERCDELAVQAYRSLIEEDEHHESQQS